MNQMYYETADKIEGMVEEFTDILQKLEQAVDNIEGAMDNSDNLTDEEYDTLEKHWDEVKTKVNITEDIIYHMNQAVAGLNQMW